MENTLLIVSKPHASDQSASYRLNQILRNQNYFGYGIEDPYSCLKVVSES